MDVDRTDALYLDIPVADLLPWIPSHAERRAVLARESFAATDGFRILVLAAYKYLFGMNVCWWCPGCNDQCGVPCQDLDGRSCFPEGGILARAEAAYACIESQKATGSLHAHIQVFIQCLHQHTPLDEVLQRLQSKGNKEINGYLKYKEHVCRQVYADPDRADKSLPS